MQLKLTSDELLTTTRAVRKRLDLTRPVERKIIEECITIAQQAPTGGNVQNWHFLVVTDPGKRAALYPNVREVGCALRSCFVGVAEQCQLDQPRSPRVAAARPSTCLATRS